VTGRPEPTRDAAHLAMQVRELIGRGQLDLPGVASGATRVRWRALVQLAARDVALARVAEAHVDAVAILAEDGRTPAPGQLYGVWASEARSSGVSVVVDERGALTLVGTKPFCTGSTFVDRALVTVRSGGRSVLVDVDMEAARRHGAAHADTSAWAVDALRETATGTVRLDGVVAPSCAVIGEPDWYVARVGFWQGACGPAACWAGGAIGLLEYARRHADEIDPSSARAADLGAIDAIGWQLGALVDAAGDEIDACPDDRDHAHLVAQRLRWRVERGVHELIDRFGTTFGPRALAFDATCARRIVELQLYVRQHHGLADLAALGESVISARRAGMPT
jgi:hypothetical protein